MDLDPRATQDAHWKGQTQLLAGLRGKIKGYLSRVSFVGDPAALELLKETMELLEAQMHIDDNRAKAPNLEDTFKDIQLSLARIERKELATPVSKNYAAAAVMQNTAAKIPEPMAGPLTQKEPKPKQVKAPTPKETRRAKEITVHIGNEADKEKIKMLSTKDLVEALQAETKGIRGVSRLISGDTKIHAESLEAKKALQRQTEWTRKMAESAAVHVRTFSVRANGVKVENINIANQSRAIEQLQAANAYLHPGLKITKLAWSARAIRERKIYSTLHIEAATAAMANWLITEGLIEDYEIKDCERFTRGCTITQCFRCQKYGHVEKSCRNSVACGHCAGLHQSRECDETTKRHRRCAVCDIVGHKAWSTSCKIRQTKKRKTETAMSKCAPLYPTDIVTQEPLSFNFQSTSIELDPSLQTSTIPPTWTIATGKKRKNNSAHTPEPRSTPSSGKKITWADTGIMNPENMTKALAKPTLGRPRAESITTTLCTPATSTDKMDL